MSNFFDRLVSPGAQHHVPTEGSPDDDLQQEVDEVDITAEPRTAADVKRVAQELLKHGHLEESHKRELFRCAIAYEYEINVVLEPLDLEMRLDPHRGIAFLIVAPAAYTESDGDAVWLHPLVKRQRLTLEQSLLIAMLRQAFVIHEQEAGIGESDAKVAVDELLPQFMAYFEDSGSDAKNESRLRGLLDQLKPHGIVSQVDNKDEITIRPMIVHLANPESLTALLQVLKGLAGRRSLARGKHSQEYARRIRLGASCSAWELCCG